MPTRNTFRFKSFDDWFTRQHGPEPAAGTSLVRLEDGVDAAYGKYIELKHLLDARLLWRKQHTTALYAYQAAPNIKQGRK